MTLIVHMAATVFGAIKCPLLLSQSLLIPPILFGVLTLTLSQAA